MLCTGAAWRRPSVWSVMHHNEGCFRTAVPPPPGGGPESLRCPRSCGRRTPPDQTTEPLRWRNRSCKKSSSCTRSRPRGRLLRLVWSEGDRSSSVLCTRAALRRPSVRLVMRHNEGCFRPADPPTGVLPVGGSGSTPRAGFRRQVVRRSGGGPESLRCPRSCGGHPSRMPESDGLDNLQVVRPLLGMTFPDRWPVAGVRLLR